MRNPSPHAWCKVLVHFTSIYVVQSRPVTQFNPLDVIKISLHQAFAGWGTLHHTSGARIRDFSSFLITAVTQHLPCIVKAIRRHAAMIRKSISIHCSIKGLIVTGTSANTKDSASPSHRAVNNEIKKKLSWILSAEFWLVKSMLLTF